uniref:Uncharacterized protein n=1 Tax=Arundo donax TaxID=35708 RepID=A0A0A9H3H8_ARUDO
MICQIFCSSLSTSTLFLRIL